MLFSQIRVILLIVLQENRISSKKMLWCYGVNRVTKQITVALAVIVTGEECVVLHILEPLTTLNSKLLLLEFTECVL